jgi:hypothetical protein
MLNPITFFFPSTFFVYLFSRVSPFLGLLPLGIVLYILLWGLYDDEIQDRIMWYIIHECFFLVFFSRSFRLGVFRHPNSSSALYEGYIFKLFEPLFSVTKIREAVYNHVGGDGWEAANEVFWFFATTAWGGSLIYGGYLQFRARREFSGKNKYRL